VRLKRVDCSKPGLTRRARGKGFEYLDQKTGQRVTDVETLDRIRNLVLPPAWRDVWISPVANGHLQAVGTDAAGRRQYRYHDEWRRRKDAEKFDEMLVFARTLPAARELILRELETTGELTRTRVLAAAVRLLDQGFFRVGTEEYTEANDTFGLATIRREHVTLDEGGLLTFDYLAKGNKRRVVHFVDPAVAEVVGALKLRSGGGEELLAFRDDDGEWRDVRSTDVNAFIKQITGGDYSAKDFRTWNATVYAAVVLAVSVNSLTSQSAAKRAKSFAAREVSEMLGNTPTVARNSYIDPRVFDRFDSGWTIAPALELLGEGVDSGSPAFQGSIEEAVLDLLENPRESDIVERVKVA
jgi:DNA topoisomerase IB